MDEATTTVVVVVKAAEERKRGSEEWKPRGSWIASEDCRV